jgi:hypothetical protein
VLNKLMGSVCGHDVHGSGMTEGLKGKVRALDLDVMEVGQLVTRTSWARPGGWPWHRRTELGQRGRSEIGLPQL